jgi:uncharacterized repeat protein (TIGR03943 family)
VTPLAGGTTVLLVGVMLIRLTVTDAYQRYVRVGMGPWLLLAGVLLAVLGASAVLGALRGSRREPAGAVHDHHGHGDPAGDQPVHSDAGRFDAGRSDAGRFNAELAEGGGLAEGGHGEGGHGEGGHGEGGHGEGGHGEGGHGEGGHGEGGHGEGGHGDHAEHGDRIGWLLLVPVLALLLVVPPALGSFGVDRSRVTAAPSGAGEFRPLAPGTGVRSMTMLEFDQRAFDHDGESMRGARVRLTGFVARSSDGAGFQLARYQISCCAADAVAAVARVAGASGAAPTRDAWFTVTGTFTGLGKDGVPEFSATAMQQITAPVDPYE